MSVDELRLRPVVPADRELLLRIYASTRAAELAPVPWSDEQKATFLRFQFEAQSEHYEKHYPDATFSVIEHAGVPAGRLYVNRGKEDIRLVDIALLPEHCGHGIGSKLLAELMAEATSSKRRLSIHVERENRALGLYTRLGFTPIGETGIYLLLAWRAED